MELQVATKLNPKNRNSKKEESHYRVTISKNILESNWA
jgi:uncharacterized protein (DUF736 family)